MIYFAIGIGIFALVVSLVAILAIAEAQLSIKTLQEFAGYSDEPRLLPDVIAALYGMPIDDVGLDVPPDSGVLFLSTRCLSCHNLALGFDGTPPIELVLVLAAVDLAGAEQWIRRAGLETDHFQIDLDGVIGERLGLNVTPAYLAIRDGRVVDAKAVASARALLSEIEEGPDVYSGQHPQKVIEGES